jgi:uncharacterized protein YndB with AHSA1/START domain
MLRVFLTAAALFLTTPTYAEVKSATDAGFEVSRTMTINATPAQLYRALGQPSRWWSKAHTYSGDARNLSMALTAGGCFCERIPHDGGTVLHARIVFTQPGKQLRLQGSLGPLQSEGVTGTLTWSLKPVSGGTEVTQNYIVGGYIRGGAKNFAAPVDQVLGEQLSGLKIYVERTGR